MSKSIAMVLKHAVFQNAISKLGQINQINQIKILLNQLQTIRDPKVTLKNQDVKVKAAHYKKTKIANLLQKAKNLL